MHCGAGRICQTKGEVAECICIPDCPEETDKRRHVCSNKNETWPSDCSVYQQRCLCNAKEAGCKNPDNIHLHIDYYGECRILEVNVNKTKTKKRFSDLLLSYAFLCNINYQ